LIVQNDHQITTLDKDSIPRGYIINLSTGHVALQSGNILDFDAAQLTLDREQIADVPLVVQVDYGKEFASLFVDIDDMCSSVEVDVAHGRRRGRWWLSPDAVETVFGRHLFVNGQFAEKILVLKQSSKLARVVIAIVELGRCKLVNALLLLLMRLLLLLLLG
jgi:fructose/tagatose bisphosphate aldolase